MCKWFNSQPRVVQVCLLLVPPINWIVEILVRWNSVIVSPSGMRIFWAIFVTLFGLVWGYIDIIWCLLFNHLMFVPNLTNKEKAVKTKNSRFMI